MATAGDLFDRYAGDWATERECDVLGRGEKAARWFAKEPGVISW